MRVSRWLLAAALVAPAGVTAVAAQPAAVSGPTDAQVKQRVDALVSQMTLEEKVGQLEQISGASFIPGSKPPEEAIRAGRAGSVLWLNDTKRFNELQKVAVEQSRLKIPLLFGLDVIHGYRTIFPVPLAMAASWDPSVHERGASVAAKEARAAGIHWTFAPMLDIARDARWGRIVEGAGEDPYLGAAMAAAQVRGFQGPKLGTPDHVLACAKHFGGYGAADGGRDYDPSYLSDTQLRNVILPAVQGRRRRGRRQLHERLHGPQQRAGGRQQVAADRRAARRVGLQGLRGERRDGGRQPGHPALRPRPQGRRAARADGRQRHGDGERRLPRAPRGPREGGQGHERAARHRGAPRARDQGAHGPVREPLHGRGARGEGDRRTGASPGGPARRPAHDGAAAQRGRDAAARDLAQERRGDRPAGRLEDGDRGLVDGVRPRAGGRHGAAGSQGEAARGHRQLRARPGDPAPVPVLLRVVHPGPEEAGADAGRVRRSRSRRRSTPRRERTW